MESDGGVIMRSENPVPKAARCFKHTTNSKHNHHIPLLSANELSGHVLSKTTEI